MLGRGVCAIFVLINGCVRETNDLHPGVLFFFATGGSSLLSCAVCKAHRGRRTSVCLRLCVCMCVCVYACILKSASNSFFLSTPTFERHRIKVFLKYSEQPAFGVLGERDLIVLCLRPFCQLGVFLVCVGQNSECAPPLFLCASLHAAPFMVQTRVSTCIFHGSSVG